MVVLDAPASAELIYGLFNSNTDVVSFDTGNTGTLLSNYPLSPPPLFNVSGLIAGLAVQPGTGQLYGVSGTGIYAIDPNNGVTTLVAPSPEPMPADAALSASFQPGTSNLFVTYNNSLLEVNLATGVTTNLGQMSFAPMEPNAGETSFVEAITWGIPPGGASPVLYGIDPTWGLVAINSSNGQETTIGHIPGLATGFVSGAGFTYSELTGTAYLRLATEDQLLYTIDLANGQIALVEPLTTFLSEEG